MNTLYYRNAAAGVIVFDITSRVWICIYRIFVACADMHMPYMHVQRAECASPGSCTRKCSLLFRHVRGRRGFFFCVDGTECVCVCVLVFPRACIALRGHLLCREYAYWELHSRMACASANCRECAIARCCAHNRVREC